MMAWCPSVPHSGHWTSADKEDTGLGHFLEAARNGDWETVRQESLKGEIDVNGINPKSGRSALILAAMNGHLNCVKHLIETEDIDINCYDFDGNTALILSAGNGHVDCVRYLVETGLISNINHRNVHFFTALMLAATHNHRKCVAYLSKLPGINLNNDKKERKKQRAIKRITEKGLHQGLDQSHENSSEKMDGYDIDMKTTALMLASKNGHCDCVRLLVDIGHANVNVYDRNNRTALMFAAKNGHYECVKFLARRTETFVDERDTAGQTALMMAAESGNSKCIMEIIRTKRTARDAKNRERKTALMLAAGNGHTACVSALLNGNMVDPNIKSTYGFTSLMHATLSGHVECVKVLAEYGMTNVNRRDEAGMTALMHAADAGLVQCVKALMDNKRTDANAGDKTGMTALMHSIGSDRVECVSVMMEHEKINVNAGDEKGMTALMYASISSRIECIKLLIEHERTNVNISDVNGMTALMHASVNGCLDCIKALMKHEQIDVNEVDKDGRTALMHATIKNHVDCVKAFLEHGVTDLNMQDNKGRTALMLALLNDSRPCAQIFIGNSNVNVDKYDKYDMTAFMMAIKKSNIICLQDFFQITKLTEQEFKACQKEHSLQEIQPNALYYDKRECCTIYMPGMTWKRPYMFSCNNEGNSILKLCVRKGLRRCVLCFLFHGLDIIIAEDLPCNHSHLDNFQSCVWDKNRRLERLSMALRVKDDVFEYCVQFQRIRFHLFVISLREIFLKNDVIPLLFYKKLCSFVEDSIDIDRFLCILYNSSHVGECVDYLLSVYLCQNVSDIILAEKESYEYNAYPPSTRLDFLLNHISDKNVLLRYLQTYSQETNSLEITPREFDPRIFFKFLDADVFLWEWYPHFSFLEVKALVRKLLIKRIAPKHFVKESKLSSPILDAFMRKDLDLLRYLVANFYFAPRDLAILQEPDTKRFLFQEADSGELSGIYLEHFCCPWRLERLSFLALSDWLRDCRKPDDEKEILDVLPGVFRSRLASGNPMQLIDVSDWGLIDLNFLSRRLSMPISSKSPGVVHLCR